MINLVSKVAALASFFAGAAAHPAWESSDPEGKAFLEQKKAEPGVVMLESGLLYKTLKPGKGEEHPLANSPCEVHYTGWLPSKGPNDAFDSSRARGSPTTFAPNQVIKAWTELMQLMVEGQQVEMYAPASLAYGESGAGGVIPGRAVLVFDMELLKIKGESTPKKEL